jgi:hypothetical protein
MTVNYFNFLNFDVLKLFIEEFPNFGIWWNKLVTADQYYVILYLILSIILVVGLLENYKNEFADKYNSLNIFQWSEFSLHAFFCVEMFLFCLKLAFVKIMLFGLPWWIGIIVVPMSFFIFLIIFIVLPYYVLHKITKRWTPLFPW